MVAVEDAEFWDDHQAVLDCLREPTPRVPSWFGYDERGSELFERITELPTYYLTRVERDLLRRHATAMADAVGGRDVVELGSGSAKKTRLLLDACVGRGGTTYLPVDVSREMLQTSGAMLRTAVPGLTVQGLWGRYEAALDWLRGNRTGPLLVAFLGSNLGNATPLERAALLAEIGATLQPGDQFLVSADLEKSAAEFETCYNDPPPRSAFAEFRLNYLRHLNRRFAADFALDSFRPVAHYDSSTSTVEGHLYSTRTQTVSLPALSHTLRLRRGESLNVGYSSKFTAHGLRAELAGHGFTPQEQWTDDTWQYGIFLFRRIGNDSPQR
ncbi:hypothetical protein GIY23_01060 [Allosaccharopolyspora coralli]|uniref:Histidine-specific methyltransferase SAM-dependent domain-containing protein n=1 Tax=Allosaccharopolyspora coralli TaxID=2665642 RepID=A0A5Q3QBW6_9PSEU|nr:hypothetical protein GIY23_01060 [Allosaccharopolyspora coralli]